MSEKTLSMLKEIKKKGTEELEEKVCILKNKTKILKIL